LKALRLELRLSKKEILKLYASHAPFGGNVVGLEAASWRYFGRPPELLSWGEAALLAVLPNSPSLMHPGKNREKLKEKRNRLLERLHGEGIIDKLTMKLSLKEPLPSRPVPLPRLAPHLIDTLVSEKVFETVPRIKSTLNFSLQKGVRRIVSEYSAVLRKRRIQNAAVIVIDNSELKVKAYVGNNCDTVSGAFGCAIDIIRKPRSTGSILKPILFAAMLQAGEILPSTLIPDLPTQYGNFMPQNYDQSYRGAVPARLALARSLNVPAVRMLKRYGTNRFYDLLKNLGMSTLWRDSQDYGLTLILGGAEGTLWDLSGIYANLAALADGGRNNRKGNFGELKIIESRGTKRKEIADIGPGAAWLTMDALLEVNRPGLEGYWRNFGSSRKVAWKTGTSYGHRDAWAIGSDGKHTVGVWAGNATGEGRPEIVGVFAAAPLMFKVFNRLEEGDWFEKPELYLKEIDACKDDGYLPYAGCETEKQLAPFSSEFGEVTPNHIIVHLDSDGWRVNGKCESVSSMLHKTWFVLPPGQEFFYRKHYSNYMPLPPYRKDCEQYAQSSGKVIEFLYPNSGNEIYIPVDLAEKRGRVIFKVTHRKQNEVVFWHLDGDYIGKTKFFHEMALYIKPGTHKITVVDSEGNYTERKFEILARK